MGFKEIHQIIHHIMNPEAMMLVEAFNQNAQVLVNFMSNFINTLTFKIYKSEFDRLVLRKSDVIIKLFALNVLQYEEHIMSNNDDFFLGYTNFDADDAMKVFEFKSMWYRLDEHNKDTVREYMKLLCNIAVVYKQKINS